MNEKITVSAIVAASLTKVWNYYTQPEHITQWNFAADTWHCPKAENNLIVGGTYKARMEAKDGSFGFDFEAIYTEINPQQLLRYEFGGRIADVQFQGNEYTTTVIIEFDPETENPIDLQRDGWQAILNNFKAYTENN